MATLLDLQGKIKNLLTQAQGYFNPESNNGQNFWSTPAAQGLANTQAFVQNPTAITANFADKIQNPVLRIGASIPQGIINTPADILRSGSQIGQDVRTGQIKKPTIAISDAARAALPVLSIASFGGAGAAAKAGGQATLKEALLQGAKTGALYGGGFGALQGLQSSRNARDVGAQAIQAAIQALVGAGAGGAVGGGLAGAGYAANKLTAKPPPPTQDITPEEYLIEKYKQLGIKGLDQNELMNLNLGALQQASQEQSGLGLLAKYDQASHMRDTAGMQKIAQQIVGQPQGSQYDPYKDQFARLVAPPPQEQLKQAYLKQPNNQQPEDIVRNIQGGESPQVNATGQPNIEQTQPDYQSIAQQARLAHQASSAQIRIRANTFATQAQDALQNPTDQELFRQALEHPEGRQWLSEQASSPDKFNNLVDQYQKFTDYVATSAKTQQVPLNFVQDYYTHIVDLKTPEEQQAFQDFIASRAKDFTSGFTKSRYFANIDELRNAGFDIKNQSVAQDAAAYANSMAKQISAAAYDNTINKLLPGGAMPIEAGIKTNFVQSNVPGNEGTFIDPQIQKYQDFYNKSAINQSPVVRSADKVNQFLKAWDLALGGFHGLKTTARALVSTPSSIPSAIYNAVDPQARAAFNQKAIDDGVIDFGTKMGVTFDTSGDVLPQDASFLDTVGSKNPITNFNRALFGGLINTYKVNLTRGLMDKFPDAATDPAQAQAAQAYGAQINNLMGGLNYEALGRNKTAQQLLRFGVLAPDFNEGKLRQIAASINPTDNSQAAWFARQTLAGEAVVMMTLASLGSLLTTGKVSNDFKDFVQNRILNPNIPLPNNTAFNRNGKQQAVALPGSDVTDIYRGITDPQHFVQARAGSLISKGAQLVTGKDYYGRPLVDPFAQTGQDNLVNRAKAMAQGTLPIPGVQVLKVIQGKETPAAGLLNTLGGRVINNPNDPTVMAQQQYFSGVKTTADSLNPNDQQIFMGVIHPTTKDYSGNPVIDKNVYSTPAKFEVFLSNPKVYQAELQFQQSQPNHDPFWDWTPGQQRAYMQAQVISKNNPGGDKNTTKALYATIPQQLFDQRTAYFDKLNSSGQISGNSPLYPSVKTPPEIAQFWNDYHNLPYGTGARSAALKSPLGVQALDLLQQQTDLTNQQRVDMGLPLLPTTGGSGFGNYAKRPRRVTIKKLTSGRISLKKGIRKRSPAIKISTPKTITASYKQPKAQIVTPKANISYKITTPKLKGLTAGFKIV